MLHVIYRPTGGQSDDPPKCAHFEVGESTKDLNPETVTSVLAEGRELHEIIMNFEGLPRRFKGKNPGEQSWFGDHAKFIVANWK